LGETGEAERHYCCSGYGMTDEINRTDNDHWENETEESAEFSSFNRLASMLISVPSDQIRAKLEEVKKNKGANATPAGGQPANEIETASHKDPD
jgi:hypothetical protein